MCNRCAAKPGLSEGHPEVTASFSVNDRLPGQPDHDRQDKGGGDDFKTNRNYLEKARAPGFHLALLR